MTRVPFTTTWIEEGKILAGSIPQLPEDLLSLRNMGIKSILTLTRRDPRSYPDMYWLLQENFIWSQWAIPDVSIAEDTIQLSAASTIEDRLNHADECPIYVHCRGGIGRTGMILLAYYVLHRNMTLAQAKEVVKVRRNHQGNASAINQGSPQKEWIDSLESRR